jgi:threonine dehydratase
VVTELAAIEAAATRIAGRVRRTPLLWCEEFGIHVKAENLQHTGSFKVRGVFNALLCRGGLPKGVATFSAGNAAAAVAYAARELGIPAAVCMRPEAVAAKVEAVRRYGGEIVFTEDLLGSCHDLAAERGYELLHPFDDPDLIAGHGTAGLEILADCPVADLVIVPVGGGGLISGVAAAVKAIRPGIRVVGVEPATANAMSHALRTGRPDPLPAKPVSIADGLTAPFAGTHTLAHVQALVDEVVEIDEAAIEAAWWPLIHATRLVLEPSAVVGLAALQAGLVAPAPGAQVVLVASGGNTALPR